MASTRLPRDRADVWAGGLAVPPPAYAASISAANGTVVAGSELIYRLSPGATGFQTRKPPEGAGDVVAVAVEPRRAKKPQRIAIATMNDLHLYDGKGVASAPLPEEHGEITSLLWGPLLWTPTGWAPKAASEPHDVLYVRCAEALLLLMPGGGPHGTFMQLDGPVADAVALATDHAGGFAFACIDEESWEVDVCVLTQREPELWHTCELDASPSFTAVQLAIAGKSVAVSLGQEGIWMTRDYQTREMTEIEELRAQTDVSCSPSPIAFDGPADGAALFAAIQDTATQHHIARVDAQGRVQRIVEMEIEDGDEESALPPIQALAWDATRRTLWSAAGRAGVMYSTAPGASSLLGAGAPS